MERQTTLAGEIWQSIGATYHESGSLFIVSFLLLLCLLFFPCIGGTVKASATATEKRRRKDGEPERGNRARLAMFLLCFLTFIYCAIFFL